MDKVMADVVAMKGYGTNNMDALKMGGKHARGQTNTGAAMAATNAAREMAARNRFVEPPDPRPTTDEERRNLEEERFPYYMNNYDGIPVPYAAPTEQKEYMQMKSAIRDAANAEIDTMKERGQAPNVIRTDPITEGEVAYLKTMKDQAELAKFDEYVESFIDPRQPGNMKWLMEVYPDYVERRLQQAHTDYEYALRNQMIDSWGINTFDDLHFKYMVDQGTISGPRLATSRPAVDASYAPGVFSPWNFIKPDNRGVLFLPFDSAQTGARPVTGRGGWIRNQRVAGGGTNNQEMARGMYAIPPDYPDNPPADRRSRVNFPFNQLFADTTYGANRVRS